MTRPCELSFPAPTESGSLAPQVAHPHVLIFSTLGHGSNEEDRIRSLLGHFDPEVFRFDRASKRRMFLRLLLKIYRTFPSLIVMEGTGLAGGLALILARLLFGCQYVVSSGDAVGPWVAGRVRFLGPLFGLYERILCKLAAGFIGWTPYLAGRALTFGTRRVMTASGWAPFLRSEKEQAADRIRVRRELGIPPGQLVVGLAGSLVWSRRYGYCYGWELVEAARRVRRSDVTFLIVGDGDGRLRLAARAAALPQERVIFTGRLRQDQLPAYYASMDVGSLPQSVDGVGSFRYTTKLSEYLASRLPVVTGQIPLAYDLDDGWLWRLSGDAPWTERYVAGLAELIDQLTPAELEAKRAAVPTAPPEFDHGRQVARATAFVNDLLAARTTSPE